VFRIRPATLDDVPEIALNLRSDDLNEIVEGIGFNPVLSISIGILTDDAIVFDAPDGKAAGVAGVDASGCIWMHCTNRTSQYPISFVKQARAWVDSLPHTILYNYADIRNISHLKLLKHLGFKFLRVVPFGPNNNYFVEFVRLWSYQ
jgi:hypothetical protein